jgi:hypothetical protein
LEFLLLVLFNYNESANPRLHPKKPYTGLPESPSLTQYNSSLLKSKAAAWRLNASYVSALSYRADERSWPGTNYQPRSRQQASATPNICLHSGAASKRVGMYRKHENLEGWVIGNKQW